MPKPITDSAEREERLAISLNDLENGLVLPAIKQEIISKDLDFGAVYTLNKDRLVQFQCSLWRAATFCDLIRAENRRLKQALCRIYLRKSSNSDWELISRETELTLAQNGKVNLNPSIFPAEIQISVGIPSFDLSAI